MRLCFLGDSITEGVGSTKRYTDIIREKTGAEVRNYGVNGAQSADLMSQIQRMEAEVGAAWDCLFIWIGTNDFNGSVPPGAWYEECVETVPNGYDEKEILIGTHLRKKRSFVMDHDTFCGRMNGVLSYLRKKYADKRIILMTPIHRGFAFFGGDNYQPEELFANRIGLYLEDYVRVVREACDIWCCELVDLYQNSGLFPMEDGNAALYFHDQVNDRLHPNARGHERITETILRYTFFDKI